MIVYSLNLYLLPKLAARAVRAKPVSHRATRKSALRSWLDTESTATAINMDNSASIPPAGHPYPTMLAQPAVSVQRIDSPHPSHNPVLFGGVAATPVASVPERSPMSQTEHRQSMPCQPVAAGPDAAAAAWSKVVVVDSRFCVPQQTTLVLQEKRGLIKTDNFTITDANGQACFKLDASSLSLHDRRRLLDAAGNPILEMKHKLVSLHGIWTMTNMQGQKLAEVKPAVISIKPTIKVYLNDGDKEADYIIKGDFWAKKFQVKQVANGGEVVVASVAKESRFSSAQAFMMKMVSDADKYFLTIEPGVDAAFVTALVLLCDEIFNDQKGNGSLMGLVGL